MSFHARLRCLGAPGLSTPSGEPIRFRTRKHFALLIYMAVENKAHRRDWLAELLWPRASPAEGRHSLATAVHILRPRIGEDGIESARDALRLLSDRVELDLTRLTAGDVLGNEVTGPLPVGPFLDGFDIPDAPEFAHWKDGQQGRLLPAIKDALVTLIDRCRRTGDTRQIEVLADQMLGLDDLSEEAIRAKMEARAFAGDRVSALRLYERWKIQLADELGAMPPDNIENLARTLRHRSWAQVFDSAASPERVDHWKSRPFLGRRSEYQSLYEAWEKTQKGTPTHILILGDSGVGKSTLAERIVTAAGFEGAAVSRTQCYEVEAEIPYATLSHLIQGLLGHPGASATSPEALAEISKTVPEVRKRYPNLPSPIPSQRESARIHLTESCRELIESIAEDRAVCLAIDDIHLSDEASLTVLHLLIRRLVTSRVMVIMTARSGEMTKSQLASRLVEQSRELQIRHVEVEPLEEEVSDELLTLLLNEAQLRPNRAEKRAITLAAQGSPMVLELLVEDLRDNPALSLALHFDSLNAEAAEGGGAVSVFTQILKRLTRTFDAVTRNVLDLAAILGHRLNDLHLFAITGLGVGQTMLGIRELVDRRLLRDVDGRIEFVNELMRAAVYSEIPSTVRAALHLSVAEQLIEREESGSVGIGLEIAWHLIRGGRTAQATTFLLVGARGALALGAVHAAERALSTAMDQLSGNAREEALTLLVDVLQEQGRWLESGTIVEQLRNECGCDLATVYGILADHQTNPHGREYIQDDLRTLIGLVARASQPGTRIKAGGVAAKISGETRDPDLARELLAALGTIPVASLSEEETIQLELARAQLLYQSRDHQASWNKLMELTGKADSSCLVNSALLSLRSGVSAILCFQGKYQSAKQECFAAYALAGRLGNETARRHFAAQLALCCWRLGQHDEQLHWARTAEISSPLSVSDFNAVRVAYYIGTAYAWRGESQAARTAIARVELDPNISPDWLHQAWNLYQADVYHLLGNRQTALRFGATGVCSESPRLHSVSFAGAFARWLAHLAVNHGKSDHALEVLRPIESELDQLDALDQLEVLCARGLLTRDPAQIEVSAQAIARKIAELPLAVSEQLYRLGVLAR